MKLSFLCDVLLGVQASGVQKMESIRVESGMGIGAKRLSYQGLVGDVLALGGEEGRGRLRQARRSCQTSIESGIPELTVTESIGGSGEPGELKHLSTPRKGKQKRLPQQRRANGEQPKPDTLLLGVVGRHTVS
eukprot:TRINITY_DN218_c2_g2_i2.p3 TRINITY_DN218_c2_g2~~TRINITY_DN218_c2_g2_i2.p3  ORF type:complete len:133 (-),score=7.02 TRINITY_DN218_c2_g2_i2:331-729(-)